MISIKQATLTDIELLQKIGRQTFAETFAASNTAENLNKYLEEGFATAKLKAELANPNSEFYIAETDGTILGYLKLNTGSAQTEQQDPNALEIERIYVLQEYQGKKVGQLLYEKAVQVARQANASYIWLGVWEENSKAINFYNKNGFAAFDKHIFKLGNEEQTDILMKLPLRTQ